MQRRSFLQLGALPAVAPALLGADRPPNILWVMTDEQRPDSLGCYGEKWARSPSLDELASRGTIFESAYVPAPVCVACRSSLLTGLRASSIGVLHNQARLADNTPFLTWPFEQRGYQTASFGKKHYFVKGRQAFQIEGGRPTDQHVDATRYGDQYNPADWNALFYRSRAAEGLRRPWILAGDFPAAEEETAEWQNTRLAMNWLEGRDTAKPFFLRLSYNAPHTPVVTPRRFLKLIDADAIRISTPTEAELAGQPAREREALLPFQGTSQLSAEEIRTLRHYYYARVAFLDDVVGKLLAWMKSRNLLDNTIVVFLSDHGSHLADHGMLQKQTFYEQVGRVPYFVCWPGHLPQGKRIAKPVNIGSTMPTLLSLAGVKREPGMREHFEDLSGALRSGKLASKPVFSEIAYGYQNYRDQDRQVMVRDGKWKMVQFQHSTGPGRYRGMEDGALYDLMADPREANNVYRAPENRKIVERLSNQIWQWDRRYAG